MLEIDERIALIDYIIHAEGRDDTESKFLRICEICNDQEEEEIG